MPEIWWNKACDLLFKFFITLDFKRSPQKLFGPLPCIVDVLIRPVASVPDLIFGSLSDLHSKI